MLKTLDTRNPHDSLLIFDRFVVDPGLPKFVKEREVDDDDNGDDQEGFGDNTTPIRGEMRRTRRPPEIWQSDSGSFTLTSDNPIGIMNSLQETKKTLFVRLLIRWTKLWATKPPPEEPPKPITLVFDQVLTDPEEIKVWTERDGQLEKMLEQASLTGQQSLLEKLKAEKGLHQTENALFAAGRKKLITEPQLLKFVKGCEKGLCLDWVRHFTRPIPDEVVAEKVRCDELGIFDNYVVLHYDPMGKSAEMSQVEVEEEMARRRDPILFGVFRGSRKLYFVGDWKDDLCDLTLQEIVDKLGEPLEMT